MFGTIRKHQTWLWGIIIFVTVVSFVAYFNPSSRTGGGGGDGGRSANFGSINGVQISRDDYVNALREVELQYFFQSGLHWPDEEARARGFDEHRQAYEWLLSIQEQERLGIQVGVRMAAQVAAQMLGHYQRELGSPETFVKRVLEPRGFSWDDFQRFTQHFLGNQELVATVGATGRLVTRQAAADLYAEQYQPLATTAVFFPASNYLARVTVTPDGVSQFYSNRMDKYRVPDRVQVSYVKFDTNSFLAAASTNLAKMTNLDAEIEAEYGRNASNVLRVLKAQTLDEAKRNARDQQLKGLEIVEARKVANKFATELLNISATNALPDGLAALAKASNLTVQVTSPFDRDDGPTGIAVGSAFIKEAFSLSPGEPFAGPIVGDDGVYEIALNKMFPSEIPPLAQIRNEVEADYKQYQAASLARQAGMGFFQTLTNGLAQKKTFAVMCVEASLKPEDLPPFALGTRSLPEVEDRVSLRQLKQTALATMVGSVSPFEQTDDGGFILYVRARLPVDEAKMKEEMPEFVSALRQQRVSESFERWFMRERARGLRDTPLGQPKAPPSLAPAPGKS